MNKTYFRYHVHSSYSLCDSTTDFTEYVDAVAAEGGRGICFTEHGNVFQWIKKKKYCESKGIQYVHGMEGYLTQGNAFGKIRDNYHIVLIAKNEKGVEEINSLFSSSYFEENVYSKPRITFEQFFNISDNVILTSACLGGPLARIPDTIKKLEQNIESTKESIAARTVEYNKQILAHNISPEKNAEKLQKIQTEIDRLKGVVETYEANITFLKESYVKILKKCTYLEIQHHPDSEEQKEYNVLLYKYAKKYHKELIAATDTHSMNEYEAKCRSLLIIDKYKKDVNEEDDFEKSFDLTWKTYDELVDSFDRQGALPPEVYLKAIENTNILLDQIEDFELDTKFKYNDIPGVDDPEVALKERINERFIKKKEQGIIPADKTQVYLDRIREEFRVLKKIGMTGFILFMSNLVTWAKEQDIPVGPCRGSVGGCLIAYIVDIIDLDPIKRNTVFSRFANEDRVELGDIDFDLPPDQRHLVFDYITSIYPDTQTAHVITFGTQKALSTIDALGRIYNVSIQECKSIKYHFKNNFEKLKKKYPDIFEDYKGDILGFGSETEIKYIQNFVSKSGIDPNSKEVKEIIRYHLANTAYLRDKYPNFVKYYNGLFGIPVSQGMHAAGIIVAPSYINLYSKYGVMRNGNDQIISIDMDSCHDVALVKYDILGLKQLQILRQNCEYANIRVPYSHELNWDDEFVWKHMTDSPVGLFQFEGSYSFRLLKEYEPHRIDDMTLVNAALRPSGASYRDNLIKHIPNHNPSKEIDEILKDNNGYLTYQEDIIKFLQEICGLSGSQADTVRRSIAHKKEDELLKVMPQIIEGYCSKSSHPREEAIKELETFIQIIKDSSSYMFGKNHATGYSMLGYKCIYFRTYFPAEFITAYLNSSKEMKDIKKGDDLANELDISYLNISAVREEKARVISLYSNKKITANDLPEYPDRVVIHRPTFGKSKGQYAFDPKTYSIYKGVGSIKDLSSTAADQLYELAQKPEYQGIEAKSDAEKKVLFYYLIKDCIQNTSINKSQFEILIKLNFFNMFGPDKTLLHIYNNVRSLTSECKFDNVNKKQYKKQDLPFLELDLEVLKKVTHRETEKKIVDINLDEYFEIVLPTFENEFFSVVERLQFEKEKTDSYLTRITGRNTYYYVDKMTVYENKNKPYFVLFNLKTGDFVRCSVTNAKYFINNSIKEGDVLSACKFEQVNKKAKVSENQYIETDQKKTVLTAWNKPKKYNN